MTDAALKPCRLWEAEHPYYINEGNYYKSVEHTEYDTLDSFLSEWGHADIDMNRVHRWDWVAGEDGQSDWLDVFFVMQRKARLMSCSIKVTKDDEARVIQYLTPHMERERAIWEPLSARPSPKVRKLVWEEVQLRGYKRGRCAARSPFVGWAAYIVRIDGGWKYNGSEFIGDLDKALEDAKAAAQADYKARILGALE